MTALNIPMPEIASGFNTCPHCGTMSPSAGCGDAPVFSVIIPVYNEGGHLHANLHKIHEQVGAIGLRWQMIVVDDGSSDATWKNLRAFSAAAPELLAIRLSRNFGKEAAISAGLAAAQGEACVVMDSDLQHPPELILEMVRLWRDEGWEVVEGIKSSRGRESLLNRFGAWVFYFTISHLSGYRLSGASDFKLLDQKVVAAWREMGERNTFFRGMITWLGYRRKQILFDVPERLDGMTRWSSVGLFRLAVTAITTFSSLPLQLVTVLGGLFLACSFLFALYALVLYFRGLALAGFTTVILLQLIIGGVLMLSLGIIGTYIARIYEEAKHRPRFVVSEMTRQESPPETVHNVQSRTSRSGDNR